METTIDYNGEGAWSAAEIVRRYHVYSKRFGIAKPLVIQPAQHSEGDRRWVYPVMHEVIIGIETGDLACAQLGIEFIEQDQGFPFGSLIKSSTARSLRRFPNLTREQIDRIRSRIVFMLRRGAVPREYREYARLLRAVGVGPHWSDIEKAVPANRYAARAKAYFLQHCRIIEP